MSLNQNLYSIEIVVNQLVLNSIPPEDQKLCVEVEFLENVLIQICDKKFELSNELNGKSCIFTLPRLLTKEDGLNLIFSKTNSQDEKVTLGKSQFPVKEIFDKISNGFDLNEISLESVYESVVYSIALEDIESNIPYGWHVPGKSTSVMNDNPKSETVKNLFQIIDLNGEQIGCAILIMRITCFGPTIKSCFKNEDKSVRPPPPPQNFVVFEEKVENPYEEFTTEMNENSLTIRIAKNENLKTTVFEKSAPSFKTKNPVILGNLKYPGRFDHEIDSKQFIKNPNCDLTCLNKGTDPLGVEVTRKVCDNPNVDVFVLKIGKKKNKNSKNSIELELRTPKGPQFPVMETKGMQVIEEDFFAPIIEQVIEIPVLKEKPEKPKGKLNKNKKLKKK